MDRSADDRLVQLGKIVGVFGVQGAVKLESWTEPRMQIFKYQPWLLKSATGETKLSGCRGREQGKGMIAQLPAVTSPEQAATLIGSEIWVQRDALPKAKPGEYYWADLEGLEVINRDGVALGTVSHLFATGANDVLVTRLGEQEHMIPFVIDQYICEIDLETRRVVVDWDPAF